jgi:hypothetical protein
LFTGISGNFQIYSLSVISACFIGFLFWAFSRLGFQCFLVIKGERILQIFGFKQRLFEILEINRPKNRQNGQNHGKLS